MLLSQHLGDFPFFSQVGAQSHTVATINKILSVEAEPKLTDVKASICYFLKKSNCNLTHHSALLPPPGKSFLLLPSTAQPNNNQRCSLCKTHPVAPGLSLLGDLLFY